MNSHMGAKPPRSSASRISPGLGARSSVILASPIVKPIGDCFPRGDFTADSGTVLFFSMATNFSTAALTADGMASNVRMLVGNGFTPDVGAYALDLVRRTPALREALGV